MIFWRRKKKKKDEETPQSTQAPEKGVSPPDEAARVPLEEAVAAAIPAEDEGEGAQADVVRGPGNVPKLDEDVDAKLKENVSIPESGGIPESSGIPESGGVPEPVSIPPSEYRPEDVRLPGGHDLPEVDEIPPSKGVPEPDEIPPVEDIPPVKDIPEPPPEEAEKAAPEPGAPVEAPEEDLAEEDLAEEDQVGQEQAGEPEPDTAPAPEAPEVTPEPEEKAQAAEADLAGHMAGHVPDSAEIPATDQVEDEGGADSVIVAAPEETQAPEDDKPREGWFARLRKGLTRSSDKIGSGITDIFTKRKLDDETLEELEDLLITADLGPATATRLSAELAKNRFGKDVSPQEVREELSAGIAEILKPVAKPLTIDLPKGAPKTPLVILVAGVNGSGKTTTIGKLGKQLVQQGYSVMLGAGDTFRAAAVEQLQIWGDRIGCDVVTKDIGADAAALAYEALDHARKAGTDILLLDTAGRLQNKANLMEELQKIIRVLKKQDENAPHQTLLVLDATVGQNAHSQVEIFGEMVNVTGLVVTKLDGSAKGGVIVSLAEKFGLPVHAIGVGEGVDDLRSFKADDFARSLMGL